MTKGNTQSPSGKKPLGAGRDFDREPGRRSGRGSDRPSGRPQDRPGRGRGFAPRGREEGRQPFGRGARAGDGARHARFSGPSGRDLPRAEVAALHELFPALSGELGQAQSVLLARALDEVSPLKRAHRQELPLNIIRLSRLLTVNRAEMRHPYWASPAMTSAYLHYFLPWNIFRLSRLFAGLQLPLPPEDGKPLVVDLGSGPLSVPLALWLANPAWRSRPVVVAAVDCAGHPLQLGKALLESLARQEGLPAWEVHTIRAPLEQGLRKAAGLVQKGAVPWLVTAANVLNELPPQKKARFEEDEEPCADQSRLADILAAVSALLRRGPAGARALFVEPGTRLGGLTLMGLRDLARERDMTIYGPCPHAGLCPLYRNQADDMDGDFGDDGAFSEEPLSDDPDDSIPEDLLQDLLADEQDSSSLPGDLLADGPAPAAGAGKKGGSASTVSRLAGRSWCHFTFTSEGAPSWLAALAEPTGLAKDTLSLACLELGAPGAEGTEACADNLPLRVISQPFPVPGYRGACRYACSPQGLVLLENAGHLPSGSLVELKIAADRVAAAPVDARSGARCLGVLSGEARERTGRHGPAEGQSDRRPSGDRPGHDRRRPFGDDRDRRPGRMNDRKDPSGRQGRDARPGRARDGAGFGDTDRFRDHGRRGGRH